jgi:ribulose-phosphate 3-epimerase
MKVKVATSILSANFSCLAKEIRKVERAGADMIHIDVMDGHFVPNITIGPVIVKDIRRLTKLPLDVHLMIEEPIRFIKDFIKTGSDMITVHIETIETKRYLPYAKRLKSKGIKLGVSLNPATSLSKVKPLLDITDFVLVMSVNPGFSGQSFIPKVVSKIRQLRKIYNGNIAVDGGINPETARLVVSAGANILVAGSYIFNAKNYKQAIGSLKRCQI